MAEDELTLRRKLCDHLSGVANYNDKGIYWSRHTPDEVRANQEEAQREILDLVARIGEAAFSQALWRDLGSGAGSTDGSGLIAERARRELLGQERRSEDRPH